MTLVKKRLKHASIILKDEDEEDEEEEEEDDKPAAPEFLGRGRRNAVLENRTRVSFFLFLTTTTKMKNCLSYYMCICAVLKK